MTIPLWEPLILQNNWSNYEPFNDWSRAAYTKTSDGIVVVKGMINRTGSYTVGETVATLPVGYRPVGPLMFGGMSNSASSRIDVQVNGNIDFSIGHASIWSSLDSIRFVASGAHAVTNVPTLLNGWTNFGSGWQVASHIQDSNSRVWVQGLLAPGTNADNTQIFAMPSGRISTEFLHIPARGGAFRGIAVNGSGILVKGTGSTGYHSVTAMYYPDSTATWTTMTPLGGGWQAFPGFSTPAYTKGTDNIVTLKGLLRLGTATSGTVIFTLPSGFRPKETLLIPNISNQLIGRVDINENGQIIFRNGSNTWFSLDGISFLAEP